MKLQKELEKYFGEVHFNCAEATLLAAQDFYQLGSGIEAARYMSAFGGGMGCGRVCGALIGAQSALGLLETRAAEEPKIGASAPRLRTLAAEYLELFEERLGSCECSDIKPQFADCPGGCQQVMRIACDLLEDLVQREGSKN